MLLGRVSRILVAVVLIAGVATLSPATAVPARADGSVVGDDDADAYVGTGGLILPPTVDEATRHAVASCAGCAWRVTTPCASTDLGAPLDDTCASVVRGCPGGELRRTWFQPAGGSWRDTGLVCVGSSGLWTVREAGEAVGDRLERKVPALGLMTSPEHGILPHLPTYFTSGMPGGTTVFDMAVAGHELRVRATPTWTWFFGDGASLRTDDPGGAYPRGGVTHSYRVAGSFRVTCTARWSAEFWSDGLGPFPVPEALRQDASVDLSVGEGRAVLIPGAEHTSARGTMVSRPARPS